MKDIDEVFRQMHALFTTTTVGAEIDFSNLNAKHGVSYGLITKEMKHVLRHIVEGRKVFDIMAGDGFLSQELKELGAREVVAIDSKLDKNRLRKVGIRAYEQSLDSLRLLQKDSKRDKTDVAFCSWIPNHPIRGFLTLLREFQTVIYLGKNFDYTACAWPGFFQEMLGRDVLHYITDVHNSFIVYGPTRVDGSRRELVGEELAGIDQSRVFHFKEIQCPPAESHSATSDSSVRSMQQTKERRTRKRTRKSSPAST